MQQLQQVLEGYVERGALPGAVALLARGEEVEVHTAGTMQVGGTAPMSRDTIFRIASITKPIGAAGAMVLVEEGRIGLDDPVTRWLPELAAPQVVRTPGSSLEDLVPADRPVTLRDLLTSTPGWGFSSDFSLPATKELFTVQTDGRAPHVFPAPDEWLTRLGRVPMLYQPGAAWLYNTAFDILGSLIARVAEQPLHDFLAERLFEPLGMTDTSFALPASKRDRFASYYVPDSECSLQPGDAQETWELLPAFESLAGGLLGTADDWLRFGRMLLSAGELDGRRILSAESVRQLLTNQVSAQQRTAAELFLEGQGWGFGGSVDLDRNQPWNVPGRYGWDGGTGTSAHIVPAQGSVAILLTQVGVTSPVPNPLLLDFWRLAGERWG